MTGICILGGGAFGTALAITLATHKPDVHLWLRSSDQADQLNATGQNAQYLPGCTLPETLEISADLGQVAETSETVLLALPMQKLGSFLAENSETLNGKALVACCKGVDLATGLGPVSLISKHCPDSTAAILTGPSFAVDIARGLPTALTLATIDPAAGHMLQAQLSTPTVRLYLTDDVIGAELGGALKNVIALAAGLASGAGLGESARAAVITRGFAEMQRLASNMGAQPDTLMGLSGLGDLILTCTSEKSRNYAAGLAMGRGDALPKTTTEGIATAKAVSALAQARGIDMPLTATLDAVLDEKQTLTQAIDALLSRPLKKE